MKNLVFKVVDWDKAETLSYDPAEIADFIIASKVYMDKCWTKAIQDDLKENAELYKTQKAELITDLEKLTIGQELKITLSKEYRYYIKVRLVKTNLQSQADSLKEGMRMNPYYTK